MRLLSCFIALFLCSGAMAVADPAANFGTPPSGQIPILYNDHTVYAKPDILKQGRVLAALVKDGQIYVPLRSMFEQMGAAVTVSADGNTYTVTRSDASASVTLGKNEVVVNGTTRPLDVPPILYHGVVLVPVRVLSEALGAYVEWVPSRQLVVVRYIPPSPPPVESPTPMPTAEPTATPTAAPTPTPAPQIAFVAAALSARDNYNEFASGQKCNQSYLISAAFAPANSRWAGKVDFRQDAYVTNDTVTDIRGNQYTGFSTIDGGYAYTPVFLAKQTSLDARLEYQIADPRLYVGVGYIQTSTNYGYPQLRGVGVGVEKLPELNPGLSYYGSAFYYPSASGTFTVASPGSSNNGVSYQQQYQITKLDIGLAYVFRKFPVYIYGGYSGDQYKAKQNAPIGQTHDGPYLGLGVKI
ncbi:MAG TPA: stalk domain-containing protein [Candidatus Baltobacteraceae bacterium]|nr:stalk domain-containing protein [Candidatus Baltobacteraceae bacterium]